MLFRSIAAIALFALSSVAFAQGKIAVVNLEQAILQTDFAQQQLKSSLLVRLSLKIRPNLIDSTPILRS